MQIAKMKLLYPDMVLKEDMNNKDNIILENYHGNAETLILPPDIKEIGHECFMNNDRIKHVKLLSKDYVQLGSGAFANSGICSIETVCNCMEIYSLAFSNCKHFEQIDLSNCNTLGYGTFMESGLTELDIRDTIKYPNVLRLCDRAEHLKKVRVGKQIKCISERMFNGCKSLTDVELPEGLKKISSYSFFGTGIKEIVLPASLEVLYTYAFRNSALEHIIIKSDSLMLYNEMFDGIQNLRRITTSRYMARKLKEINSRFNSIQYNYIN